MSDVVCTTMDHITIYHYPNKDGQAGADAADCIWHREDGPAVINQNDNIYGWWLDDVSLDFDEWCELLNKTEEEIFMLKMNSL